MNISESLSSMFLLLIESLYKPDVVMTESVENLLILMRLAHVYDAESTLKTCQKYVMLLFFHFIISISFCHLSFILFCDAPHLFPFPSLLSTPCRPVFFPLFFSFLLFSPPILSSALHFCSLLSSLSLPP